MSTSSSIRALLVVAGLATVVVVAAGCVPARRAYVRYDYGSPYDYGTTGVYYDDPGYYGYYAPGVGYYRYPAYYERRPHVVVPQRPPVYVQPRRYTQPRVVIPPHRGGVRVTPPPGYRGRRPR